MQDSTLILLPLYKYIKWIRRKIVSKTQNKGAYTLILCFRNYLVR